MRFLKRQIRFPRPPTSVALGIVVAWSISLCVVDSGARVKARRPFVLVKDAAHCDRLRSPSPQDIATSVERGDVLWVRNWGEGRDLTCYLFEAESGQRGWAPYNAAYMQSHGIALRWRRY